MANTEQPAGDRSTLGSDEFCRLRRESLYRAVTSVTREPDTAIEAVDKAMAQAAQSWDVVSEYEEPAGWVFRVALRQSRSFWSGRRRSSDPHTGPNRTRLPDPEVNDAVASLPYRLRVVIVARFYLDWSAQQIADSLRLSLRTVNSRLRRGVHRIERSLDDSS